MTKWPFFLCWVVAVLLLTGCTSHWFGSAHETRRNTVSSSLVDFLYPNGEQPPSRSQDLPTLELPLRVGVAFVPSKHQRLTENVQFELMQRVKKAFIERPYVEDIELIPEIYLRSANGIVGMQQVARMHDIDVMAMVSYDQLTISGERDSAILYWTIVGGLLVKGNTHEVQTMVDTAVFDVASAELLIRAPGQATGQTNTTYVDAPRNARKLETESFSQATDEMILNLNAELENFRQQIKDGRKASVNWQEGRSGGGSVSYVLAILCLLWSTRLQRTVAEIK